MDEITPVKPTFLEKIKANRKVILTRIAIGGGTLLGILAATVLLKKAAAGDFEDPDVDYIVIEVPKDQTPEEPTTAE